MKTALLIIALLHGPGEICYPQPDMPTCESVRDHAAVRASWQEDVFMGRETVFYCVEVMR